MKVDINELQVRRAKTERSMRSMYKKHIVQMNRVAKNSFGIDLYPNSYMDSIINIMVDDTVIATCAIHNNIIYNLCVDKKYRGNNISYILVKNAVKIIKKNSYPCVFLDSSNPIAQHVYEKCGFIMTSGYDGGKKYYKLNL